MVNSDKLDRSSNSNFQSRASNNTKAKKRKPVDPPYTPKDDTDEEEYVFTGLCTPKRTPRKMKPALKMEDEASRPKDLASIRPFKKNKIREGSDKMTLVHPGLIRDSVEATKGNTTNAGVWHHVDALSESGLDLITPTTKIMTVAHGNIQSFSIPVGASPLPWTNESCGATEVHSVKTTSSVEQLTVRNRSQSPNTFSFTRRISDEEVFDDPTFRVLHVEKSTVVFKLSVEKAKRWAGAINIPGGLYNEEEKDLFFRLAMRGFEPLIPEHWQLDFPTLPDTLFSDTEGDAEPLIQAFRSSKTHAIKSLANLFSLGGRVRDCRVLKRRPEVITKTSIKRYIRWALCDVGLDTNSKTIPVYAVYAQKKGETTLDAVKKLNRRLQLLANRYRKALSATAPDEDHSSIRLQPNRKDDDCSAPLLNCPLLIGFIICGPILAILTLGTDPSSTTDDTDSKFISQFDLEDTGHDVWNSLAIAIAVMKIRKSMLHLADRGLGGFVRLLRGTKSNLGADV
ncbi:uncharacterized protein BDW43DRAFT_309465 [Aspergillus alliaceus]|uniref:uncharacterized protein n=1 Tax=Petromyces alliaceus TaxID=209559 RepID=UPI0012A65EF8|nr:uncharacterized protein BDW43DRAFT_309465 [Aspergillus alliaceus]KAB8235084.1 hypothetical protein BDW43DRAFT_309465 [Aspergillus alliaceus]